MQNRTCGFANDTTAENLLHFAGVAEMSVTVEKHSRTTKTDCEKSHLQPLTAVYGGDRGILQNQSHC